MKSINIIFHMPQNENEKEFIKKLNEVHEKLIKAKTKELYNK